MRLLGRVLGFSVVLSTVVAKHYKEFWFLYSIINIYSTSQTCKKRRFLPQYIFLRHFRNMHNILIPNVKNKQMVKNPL